LARGGGSTGGLHFWWRSLSTESWFLGWKHKVNPSLVVPSSGLAEAIVLGIKLFLGWKRKSFDRATTTLMHCFLLGGVAFGESLL
jgi:hypothetical protein